MVFAPRGGGKTAQRKMLQVEAERRMEVGEAGFMAVTYDRFDGILKTRASNASIDDHLHNIITRIVAAFLSNLAQDERAISALSSQDKKTIAVFAQTHLKGMTGDQFQGILREIKSTPEIIKEFWLEKAPVVGPILNFVMKLFALPSVPLPKNAAKGSAAVVAYKSQLERLRSLVGALGYNSIYVLIDKVDETPLTDNPEGAYKLVKPLLADLELLSLKGFGWKFFLWDKVESLYREDGARSDRVPIYNLKWDRIDLVTLLTQRLKAASGGKITSLSKLCPSLDHLDTAVCIFANHSPRNLIQLMERIFAHQGEINPNSTVLSEDAIAAGITDYCEAYAKMTYSKQALKDLHRVGKDTFSVSFVASDVLKADSDNTARNKISGWVDCGAVAQLGSTKVKGAKRPVNLYRVIDPCIGRLLHRTKPIKLMLDEMWHECSICEHDNLFSGNGYSSGDEAICSNCGNTLGPRLL
jgi:hypothetical protein